MNEPTPRFSIVTPVYETPIDLLDEMVRSVVDQTYSDWELILVDDCSPSESVREALRRHARSDPRIRLIERAENGHIVAASNDGLAAARGEFIVLLDHDDLLVPDALERNAELIDDNDDVDYIYSDEDLLLDGEPHDPFFKPDWSPERLRSQNYTCHLSVLRTDLVRDVGGFRAGFDGSQDHDLFLRVTEKARRIEHIPEILYHWRIHETSAAGDPEAKPYALDAGRRAIQDHLERVGIRGTVENVSDGRYRIRREFPAERRVSIVIPTLGTSAMIWGRRTVMVTAAVRSALEHTHHANLEIVVVYDAPTPERVLQELREIAGDKLVLVPFEEKFNYSRKMNLGVLASTGDRLILLNDDVEVRSEDWIEELLGPLEEPDVGLTGAKLFFSSATIQHAGLAFLRDEYRHPFRFMPEDTPGDRNIALINREVSGVTGACTGVRRDTYLEVGGLSEFLPASFNDVDFCYKVLGQGYRILYMANCELFHFESQTREPTPLPFELAFMWDRWGRPIRDPYTPHFPDMPPERPRHRMARR